MRKLPHFAAGVALMVLAAMVLVKAAAPKTKNKPPKPPATIAVEERSLDASAVRRGKAPF